MSVVIINSNRVSDKTNDSDIEHNLDKRVYSVSSVSLDFCQIPYTFKLLNSKNNGFRIDYSNQSYQRDIPIGNHTDEAQFLTLCQTAMANLNGFTYTFTKNSDDKVQILVKDSVNVPVPNVTFLFRLMPRLAIMLGFDQSQDVVTDNGGLITAPHEMSLTGSAMIQIETYFNLQSQLSGGGNASVFLVPINTTKDGYIMYTNSYANNRVFFKSRQDIQRIKYRLILSDTQELLGGGDLENIAHFIQFTLYA